MKKTFSLCMVLGFLVLFGCAKKTPIQSDFPIIPEISDTLSGNVPENIPKEHTAERQVYENKANGFSLQFPTDRTFQEDTYNSSVMFSSPISETDKAKENVAITKSPLNKTYTLEDYYIVNKERISTQNGYNELENTTIKVSDLDAKKILFKTIFEGKNLQFEEIFMIKDNFLYTIMYTATEDTFDEYIQKVDKMIASIKIK